MRITINRTIKRETRVFISLVMQRKYFITNNGKTEDIGYILQSNHHKAKGKYKGICGNRPEAQEAKD